MNVLLVRAGALGDLILLRRAIAALRRAGCGVVLLAPAGPASALVGPGLSAVDGTIDWDSPVLLPLITGDPPTPELTARLAGFDAAIAYTGQADLASALARFIPKVVGHPPVPGAAHASDWLARPVRALGADPSQAPPSLEATAAEAAQVAAFLEDRLPPAFLALHPGSGSSEKNWPSDRFAALAEVVAPGERWLLVEGPADGEAARGLARTPGVVRARGLPLRVLGATLATAGLFVGNDSGVTHLAAAWGAPTLALFGPTDPHVWSPIGRHTAVVRSPTTSIADLGLEDVVAAATTVRAAATAGEPARGPRP